MTYDLPDVLRVEKVGAVRVVTLNRPNSLNAVTPELQAALISVWGQLSADREALAVVLTGAGRAFCAGGDMDNFLRDQEDLFHRRLSILNARRLADAMIGFNLPVVAAVNGPAVGLGCSLALLSDMVVLSEDAYLTDTHVPVGLVAGDGGAAFWPFLVGMLKAKELVMLGERVLPDEALRLGLANRVVPGDKLMDEALALAQRFAELPPVAVQDTKRSFNLHLRRAIDGVMQFSLAAESESFVTPHVRQTVDRLRDRKRTDQSGD